jgi:hypothetical protein
MDLLAVASDSDPLGFVAIGATPIPDDRLHYFSAGPAEEVPALLVELEKAGVFSRDRRGCIYSRRMQRDARVYLNARESGRKGGLKSAEKRGHSGGQGDPLSVRKPDQNLPTLEQKPKAPLGKTLKLEAEPDVDVEGESETLPDSPNPSSWRSGLSNGAHHPGAGERQGSGSDEPGAIAPSDDLAKALWDLGVSLLTPAGQPEKNARALIGRWRSQLRNDERLLAILEAAKKVGTQDPVAYIAKAVSNETRPKAAMPTELSIAEKRAYLETWGMTRAKPAEIAARVKDEGLADRWHRDAP